jgi:hypothetical protein
MVCTCDPSDEGDTGRKIMVEVLPCAKMWDPIRKITKIKRAVDMDQEGWTGPAWGDWYGWEEEGGGEMVKEGKYGTNTVYTCM